MQHKTIAFLIFLFFSKLTLGQLIFEKTAHFFGDLTADSERFVDIKIQNKGTQKAYLLSVRKPNEVVYLTSNELILPDSTIFIRLQVNPKVKGKFNYEIELYTSDKQTATKLKLSGNQQELAYDNLAAFQSCPSFRDRPIQSATDFKLTVVTIDAETKEYLGKSEVSLLQNGEILGSWRTSKNGDFSTKTPLGYTYFFATHDGYFSSEMGAYINFQRNRIVLELKKDKQITHTPSIPSFPTFPDEQEKLDSTLLVTQLEKEPTTPIEQIPNVSLEELPPSNFESTYFKPVNVVFVLDISGSMKSGDKMELLQYSLNQLVEFLRPEDQLAIITYADKAKVLVASKSGDKKEKMKKAIAGLKAGGYTSGGDGIELGFKQMDKNFIENGSNQVIIITDGAFNKNSDHYQKTIEKYKSKGVVFSVVGIQNSKNDEAKMKEAAQIGNGRYVPIFKLSDAQQNLIQEIRIASYKGI